MNAAATPLGCDLIKGLVFLEEGENLDTEGGGCEDSQEGRVVTEAEIGAVQLQAKQR